MIQFIIIFSLILSFLSATLVFIFWTIGKEFIVSGYNIQLEPIFVFLCNLIWGFFYLRNENSPYNDGKSYQNYLESQHIEFKKFNDISLLWIFILCLFLNPMDDIRYNVLKRISKRASPYDTDDDSESFALFSQSLFLKNKTPTNVKVFQESAQNIGAMYFILTYLDLSGSRFGKDHQKTKDITIKELIKLSGPHIQSRLEKNKIGVEKDLAEIKSILANGNWPISLSQILSRAYRPNKTQAFSYNFHGMIEQKPWLRRALQRIFQALPTSIIERYLASKISNAYLITFHSPHRGSLARPLDELAGSGSANSNIDLYNYNLYVTNSRIGLLPKGMEFDEFAEHLINDLANMIVDNEEIDLKGGEIIVHRLGLSGEDYHLIEIPGVTRRFAIKQLQELLSNSLKPDELLAILEYGQPFEIFLDQLVNSPLFYLSDILSPEEDILYRYSNEEKDVLRDSVFNVLNINSVDDLSNYLQVNGILMGDISNIVIAFSEVLKNIEPSIDIYNLTRIVKTYLESIQTISTLQKPT